MDTGLAFFVYKRPEHTQAVINSIVQNTFKHIYIFQDGLRDEKDRNAWEEVSPIARGGLFGKMPGRSVQRDFPH